MTGPAEPEEIVVRWFGTFRLKEGRVVSRYPAPADPDELARRMEERLEGRRTAEDDEALRALAPGTAVSWDRRLGLPVPDRRRRPVEPEGSGDTAIHREVVLRVAERRLSAGWDPSVHVDEAVRSIGELDESLNRIGERLVSWSGRDAPPVDEEPGAASVVRRLLAPGDPVPTLGLPAGDPALRAARAELAGLYERIALLRSSLEAAIESAMPRRAPNLSALLGPLLAARLISQAGGLDRLARLPASTIQVLGAERAFFEHLRGRAPPPRHGWIFVHPEIQGAPKRIRGKVARALAGKAAIAARLDREGRPLREELIESFRRRSREVRSAGTKGKSRGASRPAT